MAVASNTGLIYMQISESGVSSHGIHITGAMSVYKQLIADGLNGRRQRAVFFLGNLAWFVTRAASVRANPTDD